MKSIASAIEWLNSHISPVPTGRCAHSIRLALAFGGWPTNAAGIVWPYLARNYGPFLESMGWLKLPPETPKEGYQKGDIIVWRGPKDEPAGHVAMFDGMKWISDFRQIHFFPGSLYAAEHCAFEVYRWPA